jgi:hypothetical protein
MAAAPTALTIPRAPGEVVRWRKTRVKTITSAKNYFVIVMHLLQFSVIGL